MSAVRPSFIIPFLFSISTSTLNVLVAGDALLETKLKIPDTFCPVINSISTS